MIVKKETEIFKVTTDYVTVIWKWSNRNDVRRANRKINSLYHQGYEMVVECCGSDDNAEAFMKREIREKI